MPYVNDSQSWFTESISDVTLICHGQKFHARRDLLASSSAYFKTMFSRSYLIESGLSEIELHDDDPKALGEMLSFMHGFTLESASDFDMSIPSIRDFYSSEDRLILETNRPLTQGQVIVPKLRQMVSLYIIADKCLCLDLRAGLTRSVYIEYALQGLFLDYFFR